ncbi:MAG: transposase [Deltaproteobacteria bacterium]|nr:transposase [Deltaproteobacteria bacterium]
MERRFVAILLEPHDLLSRIVALIPPPRFHLVRYLGGLSSHASRRREGVPTPPPPRPAEGCQLQLFEHAEYEGADVKPTRRPWAWLLRHVFQVGVETCPSCGGHMRFVEAAPSRVPPMARTPERQAAASVRGGGSRPRRRSARSTGPGLAVHFP